MIPDELRALYDHDQRINSEEPDVRRVVAAHTIRYINQRDPESFLLYTDLTSDNVEQAITDEIAYFESIGHDFEWKVFSHDQPPDLLERLIARGFEAEEAETILVLDMQGLSGVLTQPPTHDIRRITDPAAVKTLIDVKSTIFQDDLSGLAQHLTWQLAHHPDYMSLYGAYIDGSSVASAWINYPPGSQFASMWGGATLEAYRGRGVYTALVAARVQEAIQRGRRFLTIDASPMSRPIVEKLGFVAICTSTPCKWNTAKS